MGGAGMQEDGAKWARICNNTKKPDSWAAGMLLALPLAHRGRRGERLRAREGNGGGSG